MNLEKFPKVTIILRGYNYDQISNIADVLSESNFDYSIEITLNTETSYKDIKKLSLEYSDLLVGAGTVTSLEQARKSIESGAKFILSPVMFSKDIINLCREKRVISIPGAYTPSEIKLMFDRGADIVKVFPATSLKSKYFSDIQAPLGSLNLMAVGGIDSNNAKDFFDNKTTFLGIGSGIFNKNDIINMRSDNLRNSLKEFENKNFKV